MTAVPKIDVRDLKSVRRAADAFRRMDGEDSPAILGDDYTDMPRETADRGATRPFWALNRSPLARRIVTFNLIALVVMVAGMLVFAPGREHLVQQRSTALASETRLIADLLDRTALPAADIALSEGTALFLFAPDGSPQEQASGAPLPATLGLAQAGDSTVITGAFTRLWAAISGLVAPAATAPTSPQDLASALAARSRNAEAPVVSGLRNGENLAAAQALGDGRVLVLSADPAAIEALAGSEREKLLTMFLVGIVVSIVLSLVLASTIAHPIADLAAAAEMGRDRNARKMSPSRVRIPDLTARPDEIGRLSAALRGMVAALYERIEANEQFAADVAHEIKNPLASLRSAVGTLRIAKRDDQRETLLDIIEHDVVRLDRLVTDISTASRLDSELVKEEEDPFDLIRLVRNLGEHLGRDARAKGIDFITDLPQEALIIQGLEDRLAQVFVNLITNAISFCEDGDAIRLWVRKRDNRVLVVVEDTGKGIPEGAFEKIFQRFYSERPVEHFGNNSGLGLAISKQIVEAHGGVIWAENIHPTEADAAAGSEPLGARFVVGLPL